MMDLNAVTEGLVVLTGAIKNVPRATCSVWVHWVESEEWNRYQLLFRSISIIRLISIEK